MGVTSVSWHPFYGQSPEYQPQYYYDYPSIVQEIKDVASGHGFNGEYIVEEITWSWPFPSCPLKYSASVSAKYLGRGIMMHLGMDIITGFGGSEPWQREQRAEMRVARNLATIMAGARAADLPMQIQTTLTNTVSYTFALTDGGYLVALWTDGVAVDEDPGMPMTLTLPALSEYEVEGIDVLYGYAQPMNTSQESSNLVIRDLLVKDYPIMLRVSPIVSPVSLAISGPTTGLVDATYSFTATVDPITVTVPITYTWQATGQSAVTHAESLTVTDSVSFTWATTGTKSIAVTARTVGGAVTSTHLVTIYEPVVADFVGVPTSGLVPLTVRFTNTSTGGYTDSLWQFGDGLTSTLGSPTHTYTLVGSYTVTLSIDGPGGADAAIRDAYITVDPYRIYLPLVTRDREARRRRGVTRGQPAFKGRR